jgi:hypothetical protein
MNECHPSRLHRMSACDRQILAVAFLPVIAFATALIAARISRPRRHQLQAVLR